MSLHFICGKPGGGKSLLAMRLLMEELRNGSRPIVTNLSLNIEELWLYVCSRKGYEHLVDTWQHIQLRIRVLSESELRRFYCYRGGDGCDDVEFVSVEQWKTGRRLDFSGKRHGVMYILDEVHIAFPAREWATTGPSVLYYLSQHRKLGDDIICVTQHVENLDKQFQTVAQDFTYVRNLKKVKVGMFKLPGMFWKTTYLSAGENSPAVESGSFKLDVSGLAKCYDTAAGVGVMGRSGADMSAKRKGVPVFAGFAALFVILLVVFIGVPKLAFAYLSRAVSPRSVGDETRRRLAAGHGTNEISQLGSKTSDQAADELKTRLQAVDSNITVTACVWLRQHYRVWLSNGEQYVMGDGHLTRVDQNGAIIDGVRYRNAQERRVN